MQSFVQVFKTPVIVYYFIVYNFEHMLQHKQNSFRQESTFSILCWK